MRIIAVSGTQGSGKSTLLERLKERGYKVDDYKVSRAVQAHLGANNLSQLTKTFEDIKRFQNLILEFKMKREEELALGEGLIFTERSFADISSYNNVWIKKLIDENVIAREEGNEFMLDFADTCSDYQQIYAGLIMVPFMDHIQWVEDKNRADKEDIAAFNKEMNSFLTFLQPSNVRAFYVSEKSPEDRATQVEQFLKVL